MPHVFPCPFGSPGGRARGLALQRGRRAQRLGWAVLQAEPHRPGPSDLRARPSWSPSWARGRGLGGDMATLELGGRNGGGSGWWGEPVWLGAPAAAGGGAGQGVGPGERDLGCRRLSRTQGSAPRACSGGRPASRPSARSSGSTTKVRRLPGPLGLGLPPSRASAPTPTATELSPAPRQPRLGPLPGESLASLPQAANQRRPAWGLLPAPGWFAGRDGSAEAPAAAA